MKHTKPSVSRLVKKTSLPKMKTLLILSTISAFSQVGFADLPPYNNQGTLHYNPTMPQTEFFQNRNANPAGSQYASEFGHGTYNELNSLTRQLIYETAPKQFMDLKLLFHKTPEYVPGDEFTHAEKGWGREAIISGTIAAPITSGTQQTIPIKNASAVSRDMIIVYPDNSRGTITNIVPSGLGATITVTAPTNKVLPALPAAAEGAYSFAFLSEVEADGIDYIRNYSRVQIYERHNYIQLLSKALRFGRVELIKLQQNPKYRNYLKAQIDNRDEQLRISLSNIFWNGRRGEVTLSDGQKAKTAGGVIPIMEDAGAMNVTASAANMVDAFEDLVLSTEFGDVGDTRYLYADPRLLLNLSKRYKSRLTRYEPNDSIAKLGLSGVDLGSSNVVFVPLTRFKDPASFPASFRNKMILLDQQSITPKYVIPEKSWETEMRGQVGGDMKTYKEYGIEASLGIEYVNPLNGGILNITGL